MKIFKGECYEVTDSINNSRLMDTFGTYEEAIEAMDKAKRNEAEAGYSPTKYIIVKTVWTNIFDDNGMFYSNTTQSLRIEP